MRHLRVVLKAIELGGGVFNGGNSTLVAACNDVETIGKVDSLIAVAHPNDLPFTNFPRVKKCGWFVNTNFHFTVLLFISDADIAAETLNEELEAVADSEDNNTVVAGPLKKTVGEGGGVGGVDGVGPAGENDDGGIVVSDGGERGSPVDTEGEHAKTPDAARDEVRVLGTIVKDEN